MLVQKIYYYVILFATLMMVIGGSVSAFMAIADIASPTPYYQSFEQYKEMRSQKLMPEGEEAQTDSGYTEEQLRTMYDRMVDQEKNNIRQRATNHLIKSLGWIIVPLPIFLFFQRKLRRAE